MSAFLNKNTESEPLLKPGFDPECEGDVATVLDQLRQEPDSFASARVWYERFSQLSDAISEIQTQLDLLLSLNVDDIRSKERITLRDENTVTSHDCASGTHGYLFKFSLAGLYACRRQTKIS